MTLSLSFITQPKPQHLPLGDDRIGQIKLPIRYSLSVEEKDWLEVQQRESPDAEKRLIEISQEITDKETTTDKPLQLEDVVNAFRGGREPEAVALRSLLTTRYKDRWDEIVKIYGEKSDYDRRIYVALAMVFRFGVSEWEISMADNPDIITRPLAEAIAQAMREEEEGSTDPKRTELDEPAIAVEPQTKNGKVKKEDAATLVSV